MSVVEMKSDAPVGVPPRMDLREAVTMLKRSRFIILAAIVLCFVGALAYTLTATPKYSASARILIDPVGLQIVGTDLAAPPAQGNSGIEAESQIYVITSGNVLEGVIARESLEQHPLFGARRPGLMRRALINLGLSVLSDPATWARRELEKAISVTRSPGSFVITVNVQSESRDVSPRIANAILDVYLEQQRASNTDTARRAADALDARLTDLKTRVRTAEERYEAFRRSSGVVTAGGQPLIERRATAIAEEIGQTQNRIAELSSTLAQIRKVKDSSLDTLPESFKSGSLETLRSRYAAARQIESNSAATLGPRHPDRVTATSQTAEARRLLSNAIQDVISSTTAELERARAVERSLRERYETTKSTLGETNEANVRLRELARDAEASRTIYEAFLTRSRELSERQGLDTSNTRILGRATRPSEPSGPPSLFILIGSLFLGLGLGVALAWLNEQLTRSEQRLAEAQRTERT